MNKKLIITEEQYKKIKFFILESKFDVMAKNVIQDGDIITITTQGKKLNFVVVDNTNGQILMDVSDKNSDYFDRRAFLTFNSFNDNKLELNLASEKQKEENPPQFKTWAKWTLKDIEQIDVFRDGKVIDGTNYDPNSEENKKRKSRFIETISTLSEGDSISLETEGKVGTLVLDFITKTNDFANFEFSEKTKEAIGNPNISSVDILFDEKNIEVTENGLLNLNVITYETKDGNVEKKEEKIKNVKNVNVTNPEDSKDEEDNEDEKENTEDDLDDKKIFDILTGDTQLRNAFYKKPSFWQSFKAELTGKKPKGTGYLVVKGLIDTYVKDKISKKLGDGFKERGIIYFEPLSLIEIPYDINGNREVFRLKNEVDENENYVYYKGFDDSDATKSDYDLKLVNKDNFQIMVKEKTKTPNVYICDVIKLYKVTSEKDPKKIIIKKSKPLEDVKIRFIKSDGYNAENKN